jgi:polar amino acid transport system permease protein
MFAAIDAGVKAIDAGELESARAIGLTKRQKLQLLVIPQSLKLSLPGIFANFIFLIKETSVFSAIAVVDLMSAAKDVIGLTYNTSESLFLLVMSYSVILLPFVVIYYILQYRLKVANPNSATIKSKGNL